MAGCNGGCTAKLGPIQQGPSWRAAGTLPEQMRWARPPAIGVLPRVCHTACDVSLQRGAQLVLLSSDTWSAGVTWRAAGTSPEQMRCARPSATAVLPTPGSPIRTGLFLVRRDRIWMQRLIWSSRPITGSSLPSLAAAVRSLAYFDSASYLPSGSCVAFRVCQTSSLSSVRWGMAGCRDASEHAQAGAGAQCTWPAEPG